MLNDLSKLITEQRNPDSVVIDLKSTEAILQIFHEEDRKALAAVEAESASIAQGITLITEAFQSRVDGYITSVRGRAVGLVSLMPPNVRRRSASPPSMVQGIIAGGDRALRRSVEAAEDKPDAGAQALRDHGVTDRDVVVGIAGSGRTPYVIGALEAAHRIGAQTVFLCCAPPADDLKAFVDVFIVPVVGPETITGSTRLKAGTATKLVLNMLTTVSMIQIGKVYNNLMVDIQASNAKLIDRGARIIMEVAGTDYATAQTALECAGGSAKTAIVMLVKGIDQKEAAALLEKNDGFLRRVLEDIL